MRIRPGFEIRFREIPILPVGLLFQTFCKKHEVNYRCYIFVYFEKRKKGRCLGKEKGKILFLDRESGQTCLQCFFSKGSLKVLPLAVVKCTFVDEN